MRVCDARAKDNKILSPHGRNGSTYITGVTYKPSAHADKDQEEKEQLHNVNEIRPSLLKC